MTQIKKILIANRGEIAARIIRTCKSLGIQTVAVYADPDLEAPFVLAADQSVGLRGMTSAETYLNQDKIIAAAKRTGAQAIHPGYGFLAENADFARKVGENGLIFIGPTPEAIEAMGSKAKARDIMQKHKVPVVPGYQGDAQDSKSLEKEAKKIGYPVLVKAAAGGGGKGMRVVHKPENLTKSIEAVKREAQAAFDDDRLILERYFNQCRHIEVQVFGDTHGNVIHLGERECSLQRRHQKVVEEAPSPVLNEKQRQHFFNYAVQAAKAIDYINAGTVEFLFTEDKEIFFLEMNTRLQVEHPVTEEITGLDLVEWQVKVAEGKELPLQQDEIEFLGHALEVRLYAEDPENQFLPATGDVLDFWVPDTASLRIESGIETGSQVGVWFDPMLAKLVTWGEDRASATREMDYALQNMRCLGLKTNRVFLKELLASPEFEKGDFHTRSIETGLLERLNLEADQPQINLAAVVATVHLWLNREADREVLQNLPSGWRNNFYAPQCEIFLFDDEEVWVEYRAGQDGLEILSIEGIFEAEVIDFDQRGLRLEIDGLQSSFTIENEGSRIFVQLPEGQEVALIRSSRFPVTEQEVVAGACIAPMPGEVVKILVKVGDEVKAGEGMVILSSMKMENTLKTSQDGKVEEIYVEAGEFVEADKVLLKISEA